ncbi:NAD(P)-dependent oxidoreductase [Paenibacillus lemnae]|uniref:NAD(P)-dependent oxidoreductase n=1 Tax=Paenibacillus lemnae TaxID=1330551 RepID=A0A848MDB8_PAELE|nr:NAD(P)-dependent oxidoreductase [Paenibacillus lemnae]NMO98140.1 NAD(P)-dependent oxidoreductase [Paenibacillus lemnae]
MRVAIVGAAGTIGKSITEEALRRGHAVTAVVRHPEKLEAFRDKVSIVKASAVDPDSITEAVKGSDAVISAYGPRFGEEEELLETARVLLEAVRRSGVKRLLIVGGAGSLITDSGEALMDTPEFPAEIKSLAMAHADAYGIYQESDVDWTYLSPAAIIEPGRRTGQFRIGTDRLVVDETGSSHISVEDYAVAMLDELDDPQFTRARFTVGY